MKCFVISVPKIASRVAFLKRVFSKGVKPVRMSFSGLLRSHWRRYPWYISRTAWSLQVYARGCFSFWKYTLLSPGWPVSCARAPTMAANTSTSSKIVLSLL